MARVNTFRQQTRVFIDRNLSPAAQSARLAAAAKAGVADLVNSGRASPIYDRYVDGREGASEDSVKPGGSILYEFSYISEITTFALQFLKQRSPVKSGRYRDSFYVGVNGRFVMAKEFDPKLVPNGADIVIGNIQPYSRRVDIQTDGKKKLSFTVPPGIFNDCVKAISQRFGNVVTVKRVYTMQFPGQYRLKQRQMRKDRPHLVKRAVGTLVESPAIIISPRG